MFKTFIRTACIALTMATISAQANEIETYLKTLGFEKEIANEIEKGLDKLAEQNSSIGEENLSQLFTQMNNTLASAYEAKKMSTDALAQKMIDITDTIQAFNTSIPPIDKDNFSKNKTAYMSNALYLALMGKTLKYYLLKKHDINLADHATYKDALSVLLQVSELKVSQEFVKLGQLLPLFHIQFAWLPDMLEQM